VLQKVVQRLYDNLSTLKGRKDNGYRVGELRWKARRNTVRSSTVKPASSSTTRAVGLYSLSKIGDVPMVYHRGSRTTPRSRRSSSSRNRPARWFAVLGIETENDASPKPENPEMHRNRRGYPEVRSRQRRDRRRRPRPNRRTRTVRTRTTQALAEGTRLGQLPHATAHRRPTPRRPEAEASGLPAQALELLPGNTTS